MVAVVILAAGQSKRMNGTDKLFLDVNSVPMFEHSFILAKKLDIACCIVVTNNAKITDKAKEYNFLSVKSPNAQKGMGFSVAEGVKAFSDKITHAVFLNADQPFISVDTINKLIEKAQKTDKIIVPMANNRPTSPCVFPKRYFAELSTLHGENGGRIVWQRNIDDVLFENVMQNQMIDIDTAEIYNALTNN